MWQAFPKQMGSRTAQAPEDALQGLQTKATQFTNTMKRSWPQSIGASRFCCLQLRYGRFAQAGLKLGRSGTSNMWQGSSGEKQEGRGVGAWESVVSEEKVLCVIKPGLA